MPLPSPNSFPAQGDSPGRDNTSKKTRRPPDIFLPGQLTDDQASPMPLRTRTRTKAGARPLPAQERISTPAKRCPEIGQSHLRAVEQQPDNKPREPPAELAGAVKAGPL